MKIKEFIKKYKLYSRTKWRVTDYLMKVTEITELSSNPINDKENKEPYICIRDREGYSLYIPSKYYDEFLSNINFYSTEYRYINLTELKRNRTKRNYSSVVYDKVTPPTVKLKFTDYIVIGTNKIYIVYTTDLNYDDDLYNELINIAKIEEKY